MVNILMKALKRALIAGILAATFSSALFAQGTVPPDMQAAIFKKVFGYAKSIANPEEVTVLVAADNPSSGPVQEIVKAFKDVGLTAKAVPSGDLTKTVAAKSVVYVLGSPAVAKGVCERNGVMSITGNVSLVEGGDIAVGLAVEGGKPKIVVHKARLSAERQELSAKLLQLARVIG